MTQCVFCLTDTELYDAGSPICVQCSEASPQARVARSKLFRDLSEAIKRADAASAEFLGVTSEIPNGLPRADSVQRIENAAHKLSATRNEMMTAHNRLSEFLEHGILPDDLKRSG